MTTPTNEADRLAEVLRERGLNIAGASSDGARWFVRVTSSGDAEHDTYQTVGGDTLTDALRAAVEWSEALVKTPGPSA